MSQLLQDRRIFAAAAVLASVPPVFAAYGMRGAPLFAAGLLVWGLFPIAVAILILRFQRLHAAWGWVVAVLIFGYVTFVQILQSKSSTASLDYLWIPLWSAAIVGPIGAFMAALMSGRQQPGTRSAPFISGWRIGTLLVLLVGVSLSLALLSRFGGDTPAFSGAGLWVITPYLLACIALVLSETGAGQKVTFAISFVIVAMGAYGYTDALFLNPDEQNALVFSILPIFQIAVAGACNVVALLIGSHSPAR